MDDTTTIDAPVEDDAAETAAPADQVEAVDEELLIEEVSIDGMCGVY